MKRVIAFLMFLAVLFSYSPPLKKVKAYNPNMSDEEKYELINTSINEIDAYLEDNDTTIYEQLSNEIDRLQNINTIESNQLADMYEDMLDSYLSSFSLRNVNAADSLVFYATSLFVLLQCYLSAECLSFSYLNNNPNVFYDPFNVDVIYHSDIYRDIYLGNIYNPNNTYSFNSYSNVIELDCMLAIQNFSIIETNITKYISDTYDFANYDPSIEYGSDLQRIFNMLASVFYWLMEYEVLVEFQLLIPFEMSHNTILDDEIIKHHYSCNECNLNLNELHKYKVYYTTAVHYHECICGNRINTSSHRLGYAQYSTAYHIASCSDCDYYYLEQHTFVNMYPYALPPVIAQGCNKCGFIKM